jgi:hypothetical protein
MNGSGGHFPESRGTPERSNKSAMNSDCVGGRIGAGGDEVEAICADDGEIPHVEVDMELVWDRKFRGGG